MRHVSIQVRYKVAPGRETLGLLFKSLVIRDLRIYGEAVGSSVFHYREKTAAEADAILQMRSGEWGGGRGQARPR